MYNAIGWIVVGLFVLFTFNKFEKETENNIRNLEDKVSDLEDRLNILENRDDEDEDYIFENA